MRRVRDPRLLAPEDRDLVPARSHPVNNHGQSPHGFGAIAATVFGPNVKRGRLTTAQLIARNVTRSVTDKVVGGAVADIGKQVGGSIGGSVGRALVRGALGGLLRR